jgi:hypothetical protein
VSAPAEHAVPTLARACVCVWGGHVDRAVGAEELMPRGLRAALDAPQHAPIPRDAIMSGSTIPTASDFFFIALKLGKLAVRIGRVKECTRAGVAVVSAPPPPAAAGHADEAAASHAGEPPPPPIDAPCTQCLRHGDLIHARKALTAAAAAAAAGWWTPHAPLHMAVGCGGKGGEVGGCPPALVGTSVSVPRDASRCCWRAVATRWRRRRRRQGMRTRRHHHRLHARTARWWWHATSSSSATVSSALTPI